ncbi:uncharacterized protein [Onthophagus taurus]|uniref:uncharacterized protein isoform X1 n=2 Tax=Onthophagus taurus TaxID=166361 RepID=UPI0039BDE894
MECFSVLWARRPSSEPVNVWFTSRSCSSQCIIDDLTCIEQKMEPNQLQKKSSSGSIPKDEDLREIVQQKAEKHREYYRALIGDVVDASDCELQMAPPDHQQNQIITAEIVDEIDVLPETRFNSVKKMKQKYLEMLGKQGQDNNDWLAPPPSGYCSSSASGGSDDEREKGWYSKRVERSASSDSALGLTQSDDEITLNSLKKFEPTIKSSEEEIQMPYSYENPYSPRSSIDHYNVPTKTLLEAQCFSCPIDFATNQRKFSDVSDGFDDSSRRESTFTDDGEESHRYRYWRTPSVVVSDYSDEVMALTLEDIEHIRNQKERSSSPDSSLHSSCSNLNYVGSTISTLDAEYIQRQVSFRKSSDCSTCSTLSGDEDLLETTYKPKSSGWRKLRNIVQWTPFIQTYKKQRYPWVQLAGHQGNFKAGPDQGTILKKLCTKEEKCFNVLMKDVLRPYVPEFRGLVASDDGECSYIQLQDLLSDFVSPCVMDCKIGVRTYLEEELAKAKEKPKLRKDMYEKMCQIDKNAPTEEEHRLKGVTKPRYMVWRETISSTATLGFRIEGLRRADGASSKDFKTTKTKEQIIKAFRNFTDGFPHAIPKYIQRLKAIKATLESSPFFAEHEVIGSSLLFVHDRTNANIWLIDFAKTVTLPENIEITHNSKWVVGNHEDGYLVGVNNLISIFMTMLEQQPVPVTPPPLESDLNLLDSESNLLEPNANILESNSNILEPDLEVT